MMFFQRCFGFSTMTLLTFLILMSFTSDVTSAETDEIGWRSYDSGMALAEISNTPVFIDFYTEWCGYCHEMDNTTYKDPRVIERSKKFIAIKVDAEEEEDVADKYGVESYPTTFFLLPDGTVIHSFIGLKYADSFLEEMDKALAEFEGRGLGGDVNKDGNDSNTLNPAVGIIFIIIVVLLVILTIRHLKRE